MTGTRIRARERTTSFKSLMSDFVDRTQRADLKWFDVDRQFRWEDVKEMAAAAVDRDVEKTKWSKNPLRAAARSFQKNASNLEMLLAFLPNGDFTGVLCGALTFVFCVSAVGFKGIEAFVLTHMTGRKTIIRSSAENLCLP